MKNGPIALTLFLFTPFAWPLLAKDQYQKFIEEEVRWIASREEIETFKQLPSDQHKEEFIGKFWQRRDPTPGTERNEYKEEYYRRWEYANANFREGVAGWRTDRGRIYLIHGPPDVAEFRTLPTTGTPGTWRRRESVVWTYFEIPSARYYRGRIALVFQPNIGITEQDVTLGESRMALEKANQTYRILGVRESELIDTAIRYRLVAAGPPHVLSGRGADAPASGIGDYARYVEDLLRAPGELLEEADGERKRQDSSRTQLREHISSSVFYQGLPLYMICQNFSDEGAATLAVAWQIPFTGLHLEKSEGYYRGKVDLMAQVRDAGGDTVDEFFRTIEVRYPQEEFEGRSGEDLHYVTEFHLPYGDYEIFSLAKEVKSETLGTASRKVTCAPPSEGRPSLSDLVLARTVSAEHKNGTAPQLWVEEWQLIPESDLEFSRGDSMVLLFKIYNAQPRDGQPRVVVSYDFFHEDRLVKKSGPRQLTSYAHPQTQTLVYSSILDLSDFPPGLYRIQVNAIDYNARQYDIRSAEFQIR